jgi:hypothetical protein
LKINHLATLNSRFEVLKTNSFFVQANAFCEKPSVCVFMDLYTQGFDFICCRFFRMIDKNNQYVAKG